MTTADLAQRLQIPAKTLAAWSCNGTGPLYARLGRHRRYRLADVGAWEDQTPEVRPPASVAPLAEDPPPIRRVLGSYGNEHWVPRTPDGVWDSNFGSPQVTKKLSSTCAVWVSVYTPTWSDALPAPRRSSPEVLWKNDPGTASVW
ncbi:helix-turn-helix domain-containing protein [Nocardia sp. NPDC055029]